MNYPYMEVPLAYELFDCQQGELAGKHSMEGDGKVYHTYMNTIAGSTNEDDVLNTLRLHFEGYLRRLRANCPLYPPEKEPKPKLFWRFRVGAHIAIEAGGTKRNPLAQLRTRLIVPDCTLGYCPQCMKTEGEPHNRGCENIVRCNHG